ncbi:16S rRNA (adenine(1518)-N(6)/adenine(1519)-N(6))-dimethyltransferase RsmA [uncultured Amnibacterium sp.]|uniref:16S rRNA (adenine(1518)-N(6)/adenine(1519)-N(6))- dimethyltransferase RsmA n=1 Tax=uncultured Amnibacterium sp. TaxID=1631851 RepID=UPI0035CC2DF7
MDPAASGLLGAADVRRLAAALGVAPTKSLGQNFVHDANTVRRIVRIAGVEPGDEVLEVGPGLGSLTLGLLEAGAAVTAVEIDARLAAALPGTAADRLRDAADRLTVVTGDAIRVAVPGAPLRLVANLPYNVAVPILLRLLADVPSLASGVVMVQAEVGERLAAPPGSKVYGSPSVKGAWYGPFSLAGTVPRGVFWPVPNVDSVLVRFERGPSRGDEALRLAVFRLVDAAFVQRRKTLRQSLAPVLGGAVAAAEVLARAGVDAGLRGERLDVDAFVSIAGAAG